jgi:hypothetical protein
LARQKKLQKSGGGKKPPPFNINLAGIQRKGAKRQRRNRLFWRREFRKHSEYAAFVRTKVFTNSRPSRPGESGAEATALQTLRDSQTCSHRAKRLECGAFTAAFVRTKVFLSSLTSRAGESGVAAALCHRSPKHSQYAKNVIPAGA